MFNAFSDLRGYSVRAEDEPEGSVRDIYLDDHDWRVRYLVVNVGFWIFGHEALIGVECLGQPDVREREWPVGLTSEEIKNAPRPENDPPVSQQDRDAPVRDFDRWPPYMLGAAGAGYTPLLATEQISDLTRPYRERTEAPEEMAARARGVGDPTLRSMKEMLGYDIQAQDGEIGSVSDFLINPLDWAVRYFVIDTGNWLPGRLVVLATDWIERIDWDKGEIVVGVPKHRIETSPEMHEVSGLTRSQEAALYRHYNMSGYWPI